MNDNRPICPHCIVEIEYEDMLDNYEDGSRYDSKWRGKCPVCDKTFIWHEIYLFDRIENFEEEVDNG